MTTPNIEDCPELNLNNYTDVDVASLNDWAIRADALMQSQAERIKELEAENGKLSDLWSAMKAKRDTLGTQLAAIAASEPVAEIIECPTMGQQTVSEIEGRWKFLKYGTQLFTHSMPAQDVTELVEALEKLARLGNGEHYGNSDGNMIARDALSKYKGAK